MTPYIEPMAGEITGKTTASLIEALGPIVSRGRADDYQFIEFAGCVVYESYRIKHTWLPWSRRPCHDASRLACHAGIVREVDA